MTQLYEAGLLDTSVVIGHGALQEDVLPPELTICAVTLAELSSGLHTTEDPLERAIRQQRLQWIEATFTVLPVDADAARYYGPIFAMVMAKGRKPRGRIADLLIASVAARNGLPLFTRNVKDFAGIEKLVQVIGV